MASATEDIVETYLSSFEARRPSWAKADPSWMSPIREAAITRFGEVGFPTRRDEEWRFTNVIPITRRVFAFPDRYEKIPTAKELDRLRIPHIQGCCLVFVDGRFVKELSVLEELPEGVTVTNLADMLRNRPESLEPHLARHADTREDAFTALNTAFLEDGAYVHLPKGAVVEDPIQLLYVSTAASESAVTYPRNLIIAETGSQANVLEHYVSLHEEVYFTNSVTEAVVGENAFLGHYWIEQESHEAFCVGALRAHMARDARFESHSVLLGGSLVRNNVWPVLGGDGCHCLVNGLYVASGGQHMDNHMRIEHVKPHGASRQFYKGILDDHARGIFSGRIIVHPDAQKTDAKQSNMNLLLSENAETDSKPQLEIYADDVKCTHGSTIGQLGEEAIFYLRSRGIDERAARNLLVFAFASESLQRMSIEPLQKHLKAILASLLPHGESLETNA